MVDKRGEPAAEHQSCHGGVGTAMAGSKSRSGSQGVHPRWLVFSLWSALLLLPLLASGCGTAGAVQTGSKIIAVGAENQYANVIAQIGGSYVSVNAVLSNPDTDPHDFQVSPGVATEIAGAQLVVQNGLGYDSFMNAVEAAQANPARKVIDVQTLLHLPDNTPNPHLWYQPSTMPRVASAIATDLSELKPAGKAYFAARLAAFDRSLAPWQAALARLRTDFHGATAATTEPVADYLLAAAGIKNLTPFPLQEDIMNGVDPSPQAVAAEMALLADHRVDVFVYNRQVVDPLTQSFLAAARNDHIPVVGVYETMPVPGYDYQSWMLAETDALQSALANHVSTGTLS